MQFHWRPRTRFRRCYESLDRRFFNMNINFCSSRIPAHFWKTPDLLWAWRLQPSSVTNTGVEHYAANIFSVCVVPYWNKLSENIVSNSPAQTHKAQNSNRRFRRCPFNLIQLIQPYPTRPYFTRTCFNLFWHTLPYAGNAINADNFGRNFYCSLDQQA